MIELWPFQKKLIGDLRKTLMNGSHASLLVSPTGSGKTVMFAYLTGRLSAAGFRTVILAHRKELLDQISDTLNDFAVQHEQIAPGIKYNQQPLVHVASACFQASVSTPSGYPHDIPEKNRPLSATIFNTNTRAMFCTTIWVLSVLRLGH